VEFYPLGVAWLEVGLWALFGGLLPMAAVHKWLVALVFIAPGGLFALMARYDRRPLVIAFIAFCLHVLVPGHPLQGGFTEVVYMGLVSNVTAAISALMVLPLLSGFLRNGRPRLAAAAAACAALAVFSNPRSGIALAVVGIGVWLVRQSEARGGSGHPWKAMGGVALVAGLASLIAAPELLSLARFSQLYYFVRFSSYGTLADFIRAWSQSVTVPVLMLAAGAVVAVWRLPHAAVARASAVALVIYVALTLVVNSADGSAFIPQLESARLMPFQRLLTLYLGAFMLHALLSRVPVTLRVPVAPQWGIGLVASILALTVVWPAPLIPEEQRSLWEVDRSAQPEMVDFISAVQGARAAAPQGTAVLVLGSAIGRHQQLWAPLFAAGPFFYDDWMWYWHGSHVGAYDPCCETAYPWSGSALQRSYLDRHAIGAVAVTGDAYESAGTSPELEFRQSSPFGMYDVYAVRGATPIVTWPGLTPRETNFELEQLRAAGESTGGTATIRHNWHPRWRAAVNGAAVPITRTSDGYMAVQVPAGDVRLQLEYRRDAVDWLGLAAAAAGWLLAIYLCMAQYRGSPAAVRPPLPASSIS
jgi:hypothetical protein